MTPGPAFGAYVALPCRPEPKWEAVKAQRLACDPTPAGSDVNAWVNRSVRYLADPVDHWQAPAETLDRRTGDCEDYAILKRAILLARGDPEGELALVIGYDRQLRSQHAVLLAHGQVLDSLCDAPIAPADLAGIFQPMFAYGVGSWAYGLRR